MDTFTCRQDDESSCRNQLVTDADAAEALIMNGGYRSVGVLSTDKVVLERHHKED